VHRILAYFAPGRWFRLVGAALGVLIGATAFTVWNQSDVNEKVYTVSLFTIGLLSWLAFRWRDNLGQGKDDNLILLMVFVLALAVGNHLMSFLAAPALIVFILLVRPATFLNWKLWVGALAVAVLGLSIHLFLPIRAAMNPVINEADPSTWQALLASLARKQYDKPSMFVSPIDPRLPRDFSLLIAQIGTYLEYFDWQWARGVAGSTSWFGMPRPLFTVIFAGLGLYGAAAHYKRDRTSWWYMFLLLLTLSAGLVFYLNFKYGFSEPIAGATPEMREVRERDYFFIASFSVWGLWAGIGLAAFWRRLAAGFADGGRRSYLLASPVLLVAFVPLVLNWSWASRRGDYVARDWAYNLLQSVEPYGVLFTNGDNDTFPLWYAQEVEGVRKDVTVIVTSYLNTDWYVRQLRDLTKPCGPGENPNSDPTRIICQRPYVPDAKTPFYNVLARTPRRSITNLSDAEIEHIAGTPPFETQNAVTFRADRLEATIPQGRVLLPSDVFMTSILTQSLGDRPVYYATTTQTYDDLGLSHFLIRQGVAFKLSDGPVVTSNAIVAQPTESPYAAITGPYIDLPRTDSLIWHVFVHSNGMPESRKHWVDKSTQGIPYYYAYAHISAAQAAAVLGMQADVQHHMARAEAWMALGTR
jgi:tryptophan-rich sensory protein